MAYEPKNIIENLMKNKRIKKRVDELNLNKNQILEALPILIDMNEQKDDKNTKYLTSFYLTNDGNVKRYEIRSSYWSQFFYLKNVKTLDFENVDFEDEKEFIKEESRKIVVNKIKNYLGIQKEALGLYLYGDMGVGKTFLLKRIAKKIAENNKEIAFITVSHLASKIKAMFNDNEAYWNLINSLKDIDFLFLDDIGSESINGWFRDDILFSILNSRMQKLKTTFFSSNYSLKKLEDIQSKTAKEKYRQSDKAIRLISRIKSLSEEILLIGTNKRIR